MSFIGYLIGLPGALHHYIEDRRKRKLCTVGEGAVLYPQSRVGNNQSRESIVIGAHSRVLGMLETRGHGGRIEIGSRCFVGENARIWSAISIKIGDRVMISHDVNIHDSNAHSLSAAHRARHFNEIFTTGHPRVLPDVPEAPVVIGNDVWIGFGACIFKGVTIGEGAVIGAQTMVRKDVAPYTIVAGNPARVIGESSR